MKITNSKVLCKTLTAVWQAPLTQENYAKALDDQWIADYNLRLMSRILFFLLLSLRCVDSPSKACGGVIRQHNILPLKIPARHKLQQSYRHTGWEYNQSISNKKMLTEKLLRGGKSM